MCDIYEPRIREKREENIQEVLRLFRLRDRQFFQKIENRADKFGLTAEEIIGEIQNYYEGAADGHVGRRYIISDLAKDPTKQNVYQQIAAVYIQGTLNGHEGIPGVENFVNHIGRQSLYICEGRIGPNADFVNNRARSIIDFSFRYNGFMVYATHTYTREQGGAQQKQYNDLLRFIENCNQAEFDDRYFVAIADGQYYREHDAEADLSRLQNMQDQCGDFTRACQVEDLEDILNDL